MFGLYLSRVEGPDQGEVEMLRETMGEMRDSAGDSNSERCRDSGCRNPLWEGRSRD